MILFESLLVALSTYSVVPVPQFNWNEKNMKYAIWFLPVIGVLCGGFLFVWYQLCRTFEISSLLFSVVSVCIPILITGGIHLDGYMDTVDALSSHQSKERKLEILKDSHCGAFSVIYCIVYFFLNSGIFYELYEKNCIAVCCLIFVVSRALSVLCAVNMSNARKSGILHIYTEKANKKTGNVIMLLITLLVFIVMVFVSPVSGGMTIFFGLLSLFFYCKMVKKQFGGVTGDTAGFFLQICELACLIGIWIGALLQ